MTMAHRCTILLMALGSTVPAQAQAPTAAPITWGVLGGGRNTGVPYGRHSERYASLVFHRRIAGRHSARFEVARDWHSAVNAYPEGVCDSCVTSSTTADVAWGLMVSWVYERRVGKRVRPYVYHGVGVFLGESRLQRGSCLTGTCAIGPFTRPSGVEGGLGQGRAGGIGTTVEWRRALAFIEYRSSYIRGAGSNGASGFMLGLRVR